MTDETTRDRGIKVTCTDRQSRCAWELQFDPDYNVDTEILIWIQLQIETVTSWKGELEFIIEEFHGDEKPAPDSEPSSHRIYREVEIELDGGVG